MERLPYVQSVAVGVWTLAGAVDEGPLRAAPAGDIGGGGEPVAAPAGISHLIEHMCFKGTESRSAKDIAEAADMMGGTMNAFTGKESTCYYIKTLSEHTAMAVELLGDILFHSAFDADELEKEKSVIYEEMKMIDDSPEDYGHDILDRLVFDGAPLGNRIIGTRETVDPVDPDAIRGYIAERYVGGNIVVSVAGNFDTDAMVTMIDAAFGQAPSGRLGRQRSVSVHTPGFASRSKDIEQSHIILGRRGVHMDADDYYPFVLFNNILGGSMSSRLFQSIREKKGLAYAVYSSCNAFVDDGVFIIYAGVGEGRERMAIDAIKEETERLASGGVTERELMNAKAQSKGAYVFGRENVQTRMFTAGRNELLLGKIFDPDDVVANIDKVTVDDVARFAVEYADISKCSAVLVCGRELSKEEAGL
jgi:predicted Zn-dependent peptidase